MPLSAPQNSNLYMYDIEKLYRNAKEKVQAH